MSTLPSPRTRSDQPAGASYWKVRRAPRYTRFGGVGGLLGLVAAVVVTLLARVDDPTASVTIGGVARSYSLGQVVAYVGLFGIAGGVSLGLCVAFAFERRAHRFEQRAHRVRTTPPPTTQTHAVNSAE